MVLRTIEQKLESLFEGVFGRAFRTNVQPVELARKLEKEMDDHRNVSVSRVYVPNEYTIYLSPHDREQFSDYEAVPRRRAPELPRRARAPRELRAPLLAEGRCSRRTTISTSASSGSRPGWSSPSGGRARSATSRKAQAEPGADDDLPAAPGSRPRRRRPRSSASTQEPAALTWDGERREVEQRRVADRPLARVRHPARGPERLAPPRRAPPGGRDRTGSSTSTRRTASR